MGGQGLGCDGSADILWWQELEAVGEIQNPALPLGWDGRGLALLLPAMPGGFLTAGRKATMPAQGGVYLMN